MTDQTTAANALRWGVLGTAGVARQVMVPGIQASHNGAVLAIASRSLDTARAFARDFAIGRAYGSYDELLEDPDVQAVYIPLPNSMHKEWTIRAAARGKHVLCEKPLASNAREAEEVAAACRDYGVTLMEAFANRFHPQTLLVKQLIDGGRIGDVMRITAVHSSGRPPAGDTRLSRELCGGVLMDKGCYCVNIARLLFGSEPVTVFATADFGKTSGVDERLTATLEFTGVGVAQFESSFGLSGNAYQQSYTVFGEKGHIYVPHGISQIETYRQGTLVDRAFYVGDDAAVGPSSERVVSAAAHQWQLEAEYFAERVLAGEAIGHPHEDGVANMRVMDAIYSSAREGRRVRVA